MDPLTSNKLSNLSPQSLRRSACRLTRRRALVCVIVLHLALALWEGGKEPFPLPPLVATAEVVVFVCYVAHILLNMWRFGVRQFR